jgi:hypothetical protein
MLALLIRRVGYKQEEENGAEFMEIRRLLVLGVSLENALGVCRTLEPSSDSAELPFAVAHRQQLRRDAERNLVRVIAPEIEADGAQEPRSLLGRDSVRNELAA